MIFLFQQNPLDEPEDFAIYLRLLPLVGIFNVRLLERRKIKVENTNCLLIIFLLFVYQSTFSCNVFRT